MDSTYITASFDTLLKQASITANTYLINAKEDIDKTFGDGYAEKNPTLVAAYMKTAASDMNTSTIGKVFGSALLEIAEKLDAIASAIEQD